MMFSSEILKDAYKFKVITEYMNYKIILYYHKMWPFNKKIIEYPVIYADANISKTTHMFSEDIAYISNWFKEKR